MVHSSVSQTSFKRTLCIFVSSVPANSPVLFGARANQHINVCLDLREEAPPSTPQVVDSVTLGEDDEDDIADDDDLSHTQTALEPVATCVANSQSDSQRLSINDSLPLGSVQDYTTPFPSEESQAADASIDFLHIDVDDFFSPMDDGDETVSSAFTVTTRSLHGIEPNCDFAYPCKKQRPCPFYKWIPGTQFTVDAFNFGAIPGCSAYFLTHFHSDHYMGLSGTFTHGPIYLSPITRALVRLQFPRVRPDLLKELPMNETTMVNDVAVTLLDANHCPGSVMFHFKLPNGQSHLHVGDFRAHPLMLHHPLLKQPIDTLFLDTTYLHPSHKFAPQHEVLDVLSEFVRRVANNVPFVITRRSAPRYPPPITYRKYNQSITSSSCPDSANKTIAVSGQVDPYLPPDFQYSSHTHLEQLWDEPVTRLLVVVGSYTVGKEKVFMSIVEALNTRFHCDSRKWTLFQTYNDAAMAARYSTDPVAANVHVVSMRDVNPQALHAYLDAYGETFSHVLAIKPTGWTFADKDGKGGTKLDAPPAASASAGSSACKVAGPRQRSILELWGGGASKPSASLATPSSSSSASPATTVHIPTRRIHMSDLSPQWIGKRVAVLGVPYSEHSSFSELRGFVRGLQVRKVVPTVGVGSAAMRAEMDKYLSEWQKDKWADGRRGEGIDWVVDGDA
ncbi:beta-lactamase-like protein [Catenaria anguillulae PL171]|uniref:Beta-lactamase-like protein n=1 Tax=Catenaria anguillulae PL171 TaxID=765915 RepID=A0A1Y2I132_9FUNG|nr:beta-lactamase-like protein [Catenaria anguillulae PL171]